MSNKLLNLVFNCDRFRGNDRLVLLAIADRINEETWFCFCDYEDLMRRCHCARSVLAEALGELKRSGVLKIRRRFNGANIYRLDRELLRQWQYPPRSSDSGRREPSSSDSGESEYGFPNANPVEPNSPPSPARDGGAGAKPLRFVSERSEEGGSSTANANGKFAGVPASQDRQGNTNPKTKASGAQPHKR